MFDIRTRMRMYGELFTEGIHLAEGFRFDELKDAISATKAEIARINSRLVPGDTDGMYRAKSATDNLIYYVMRIQRTPEWRKAAYDERAKAIGNLEYREQKRAARHLGNAIRGRPLVSRKHIAYGLSKIDIDHYGDRAAPDTTDYARKQLQKYLATSRFKGAAG